MEPGRAGGYPGGSVWCREEGPRPGRDTNRRQRAAESRRRGSPHEHMVDIMIQTETRLALDQHLPSAVVLTVARARGHL